LFFGGSPLDICYIDESGTAEVLTEAIPNSTPAFVIAGVIVPHANLDAVRNEFLDIKRQFNPSLRRALLSTVVATELKGSDLRADVRSDDRQRQRRAFGVIDRVLDLMEKHKCRLIARIIVKGVDESLSDPTLYSSAVQWLCQTFHDYLAEHDTDGLMLLDSRTKVKNMPVCSGIVTKKLRAAGDPYDRMPEAPVLGHSDSHIGLQLADIVSSALLFPAACSAYCATLTWNIHAHDAYDLIRVRYIDRIQALQYRRFNAASSRWTGGVWATGGNRRLEPLFRVPIDVTMADGTTVVTEAAAPVAFQAGTTAANTPSDLARSGDVP
jgi:hypothetical protein